MIKTLTDFGGVDRRWVETMCGIMLVEDLELSVSSCLESRTGFSLSLDGERLRCHQGAAALWAWANQHITGHHITC